ncbi:MAG: hypothetical protein AB1807_24295 [Pseudomonadota bacterium]
MYPNLRYASLAMLLAFVLPTGAALGQTPAVSPTDASTRITMPGRPSADAGQPAADESNRAIGAVKTRATSVRPRSAGAGSEGSSADGVTAVSVWALLAVLASLVLMRVWHNGKQNFPSIH